jgi:hypothetical protein
MATYYHTNEGSATDGKPRYGRHSLTVLMPSDMGQHCTSPGAHKRCRYLVTTPGDNRVKAPRNWCEYLGEKVDTVDGKKPRKDECLKDYGAQDGIKN